MPQRPCGHCGAPVHISEKTADEGGEVYCSEACVAAAFPSARPADDDRETTQPGDEHYNREPGAADR